MTGAGRRGWITRSVVGIVLLASGHTTVAFAVPAAFSLLGTVWMIWYANARRA